MSLTPCATCPWRKTSTPGGEDIPGFSMEMMRDLSCTIGDGDDFRQVMACHYSGEEELFACRGYVAIEGYSNLNVRMEAARGRLELRAIVEACEGLDLWGSFDEMLDAYETAYDELRTPERVSTLTPWQPSNHRRPSSSPSATAARPRL